MVFRPFSFAVDRRFLQTRESPEGNEMHQPDPTDPRPTDPPFLFVILLAARKSGDRMLESLARDWLAEVGIRVVFDDRLDRAGERR